MAKRLDVTAREIELAVEHIAPVVSTPDVLRGWEAYLDAMEAEGLLIEPRLQMQERFFATIFGKDWMTWKPE